MKRLIDAAGLRGEVLRFLLGGGLNTLVTLLVYWGLLVIARPQVAYAISYVIGIGLSYLIATRFVFRVRHAWVRAVAFPAVYLASYGVGAVVLALSTPPLGAQLAVFPAIAASIPVSFALSRLLLSR
jgi:putative flippase GtrA